VKDAFVVFARMKAGAVLYAKKASFREVPGAACGFIWAKPSGPVP